MVKPLSRFLEIWGSLVFGGLFLLVVVGTIGAFATGAVPLSFENLVAFVGLGVWSIFFWGVIAFVVVGIPLWLLAKLIKAISTSGKSGA